MTSDPTEPLFLRILRADIHLMSIGKRQPHCGTPAREHDLDSIEYASGYAEPGYTAPTRDVLLANWNHFSRKASEILEHFGYALEWSDEWTTCECCRLLVRTSPDSYSWRRFYAEYERTCEIVCRNCLDVADYVESELVNKPDRADVLDLDLTSLGFHRYNAERYENGFHPGQNDKPRDIVKHLPPNVDYVFQIPEVSQFYLTFDVWIRPRDED